MAHVRASRSSHAERVEPAGAPMAANDPGASASAGAPLFRGDPGRAPLQLLRLLWQVHHGLQSASKRMERDLGVTGPQRLVVRLLDDSPGMTAGELSQLLHLDPGTMSGVIRRLMRERLIRRAPDPHDRRRFLLALTPQGRLLASRREGTVEQKIAAALERLERAEIASAERALATLAGALLD